MEEPALVARIVALIGELIATHRRSRRHRCNTARPSRCPNCAKDSRCPSSARTAIKPACAGSLTRRVSVLGTEATVKREYTHA